MTINGFQGSCLKERLSRGEKKENAVLLISKKTRKIVRTDFKMCHGFKYFQLKFYFILFTCTFLVCMFWLFRCIKAKTANLV